MAIAGNSTKISLDTVAELLYNLVDENKNYQFLVVNKHKQTWLAIQALTDNRSIACVAQYKEFARLFIEAYISLSSKRTN